MIFKKQHFFKKINEHHLKMIHELKFSGMYKVTVSKICSSSGSSGLIQWQNSFQLLLPEKDVLDQYSETYPYFFSIRMVYFIRKIIVETQPIFVKSVTFRPLDQKSSTVRTIFNSKRNNSGFKKKITHKFLVYQASLKRVNYYLRHFIFAITPWSLKYFKNIC